MKIIYQDNNIPNDGENTYSGSFESDGTEPSQQKKQPPKPPVISRSASKSKPPKYEPPKQEEQPGQPEHPGQPFVQQPGQPFVQQPGQPPYYYAPVQPGAYQPVYQLTPEQLAAILQQYSAAPSYGVPPQYAVPPQYVTAPQYGVPPQYAAPQPATDDTNDPGTRVLYQSEDFDKPTNVTEENYGSSAFVEDVPSESTEATEDKPQTPTANDKYDIEEETVSMPGRKDAPPKPSMKVEEMEMSTFELNSMLSRQNRGQPKPTAPRQPQSCRPAPTAQNPVSYQPKGKDIPLNYESTFEIEDTVNEIVTDINSDAADSKKEEKKKLSIGEIIRRLILGLSIVAMVVAAGMLVNEYRLSKENDRLEEGVSDLIISVAEETTTKKSDKNKDKETTKTEETTTAPLTPEQQWAQLQAEYPNLIFPMGIQLKYAKLYATNQDFAGYLEADGINLSLPIVQTAHEDIKSPYLKRNFYGKSTKYGCPFVTHLNNIVDLDLNTVIFGHHMNNGTVFGALDEYKSIDGFKAAPVINFNTLYKDYSWKVIAAFITNAYPQDDNGYVFRYYFTSLSTEERFAAYLNELSQRSLYDTGVDVLPTDKLLTLSTCSHEFEDARFVVVARLVRNGESAEVDTSRATVNSNPRYPQAYYSKKKLTNPYANAYRWEVD